MKWIQLDLDRNQWLVLENTDVNLWIPYKRWGTSRSTWVSVSGDSNADASSYFKYARFQASATV